MTGVQTCALPISYGNSEIRFLSTDDTDLHRFQDREKRILRSEPRLHFCAAVMRERRRSENDARADAPFVACVDAQGVRAPRSSAHVGRDDEPAEHSERKMSVKERGASRLNHRLQRINKVITPISGNR